MLNDRKFYKERAFIMDIFRTVLSALFAIGGVAAFFFGWVNEGILFWFVAAVILPTCPQINLPMFVPQ